MRPTTSMRAALAVLLALLLSLGMLFAGGAPAAAVPTDEPVEPAPRTSTELLAVGSVEVSKTILGDGAGRQGAVVIDVDCGDDVQRVFTLPAGTPNSGTAELFDDIPAGTECTVTETANGANTAVSVDVDGSPRTVTIRPGKQTDVEITNTYTPRNPGSVEVSKTILGDGAGRQGAVVIDVDCGDDVQRVFTLPAGTPNSGTAELFDDIPAGTECTITETANGANTAVSVIVDGSPRTVTIRPGKQTDVEITNTYTPRAPGSLQVTKTIAGDGAGLQDDIVIEVDCGPVFRTRIDTEAGSTGVFVDDFPDLPAGSECTVTETANGANTAVSVDVDGSPRTVTIRPGKQTDVEITNTYTQNPGTGSLQVVKRIQGPRAGLQSEILILVDCDEALQDSFTIGAGQPAGDYARTWDNLPVGTECFIVEDLDGATPANSVTTVYDRPGVTITAGETGTSLVTNTYTDAPGQLLVVKTITGGGAGLQGDVVITVDCGEALRDSFTVPAGTPAGEIADVWTSPGATDCRITETTDGANDAVRTVTSIDGVVGIAEVVVTVPPGGGAIVEITNSYTPRTAQAGSLEVVKAIEGDGAGYQDRVVLDVDCGDALDTTVAIEAGATGTRTRTFDDLPAGTRCRVSEANDGGNSRVTVTTSSAVDVTIAADSATRAELWNRYDLKHKLPHTGADGIGALAALGTSALGGGSLLLLLARRRFG